MGVAERMDRGLRRRPELAIGFEAVVDDDASFEAFGHLAALAGGAVEREGFGGDRMQPLRFSPDAQAGLVEAPHACGADERADPVRDGRQRPRSPPRPFRHARGAKAFRANQVGKRLGRAGLGDQVLRVEINGGGPDAPAILGGSAHPFRKSRPGRSAAAGAGINQAPMLGDLDQPLRQIEHLTPLKASRLIKAEGRAAMTTSPRLVRHDTVGFGPLAQGLALVAFLSPARPARRLKGFFPQTIARWRLRTRRTVKSKPAPKLRVLRPQNFQLPLKRRDQSCDLGGQNHPATESYSPQPDACQIQTTQKSTPAVTNPTHPAGQLLKKFPQSLLAF